MKLKNLTKSKFGKNVLIVSGGTFLAQSLTTLLSPIITRLYSPEDYGVLTTFTALLILLSIGTFMYEKAIPIARDDDEAINVFSLSLFILVLYTIVLSLIIYGFNEFFIWVFNAEELYTYSYFIPLGVFLIGVYTILRQWAFRTKDFLLISRSQINQSIYGNGIKVLGGLFGLGGLGLILGRIMTQGSGLITLTKPLYKDRKKLFSYTSIKKIKYTLKRYKDFAIYNTPVKFIINLEEQLPIFFITSFYGLASVGFYGLAFSIIKLPMNLIGKSIADVFYAEAADIGKSDPKRLKKLSDKLIGRLFIIGLIPFTILVMFGPWLFALVFGNEWEEAGVYARMLAIMLLFNLVFSPISRVYEVFEKQKLNLVLNIIKLVIITTVFSVSIWINLSSHIAILLYALSMSMMTFVFYILGQNIINKEISNSSY